MLPKVYSNWKVKDKTAILIDDMIDTGGQFVQANLLKKEVQENIRLLYM